MKLTPEMLQNELDRQLARPDAKQPKPASATAAKVPRKRKPRTTKKKDAN